MDTIILLSGIMICFAANSVIIRYLVLESHVSPFTLTVVRFISGFLMVQIVALFGFKTFQKPKPQKSHVVGALFLGVYAFAISYGYVFISVAAGVLIFYILVVFTMSLFSIVKNKESFTPQLIIGQFMGLLGILVITFSGLKSVTPLGTVLMVVTGISWGLYSVWGKKFKNSFDYTYNSFLIFGIVSLVLFFFAYFWAGKSLWVGISLFDFGWALCLGMISTALSYILWHQVVNRIKAFQAGMVQLFVPVLAGLMGIVFLAEQITWSLMLGAILILIGIFLNIFIY